MAEVQRFDSAAIVSPDAQPRTMSDGIILPIDQRIGSAAQPYEATSIAPNKVKPSDKNDGQLRDVSYVFGFASLQC